MSVTLLQRSISAEEVCELDPQPPAVQSAGVSIGGPLIIVTKLPFDVRP